MFSAWFWCMLMVHLVCMFAEVVVVELVQAVQVLVCVKAFESVGKCVFLRICGPCGGRNEVA